MCDLNLNPEELVALQKAERCHGCRHLTLFHFFTDWDTKEVCGLPGCPCDSDEMEEADMADDLIDEYHGMGFVGAHISLFQADGSVVPIE